MRCPYCGMADSRVLDSRPTEEGNSVRRRRECSECARRFTTYERVDELPLMVVKKDSRREVFDRAKLLAGLIIACQKRPVPTSQLEGLVNEVERDLKGVTDREVLSRDIGQQVMLRLRELDEVAYVRFASVYREFRDVQEFMREIEQLVLKQD
ncbi:transcriptional repressor NrdR [Desulfotomaculum arcticum]|uniref:Transcriptional repressor NrdR n=1 Tax=Desulfotruncus arcticus DSM 17038 TaxID=1121424 RepID=A0A1I2QLE5_9FIRM|nr:transcriptional regulator NrdR [Desulfotruncus arcticus]SFG29098.1 transcriptional repressor NrdR [Desulfotomaculum arcticum] [Desulfotruncus arcticus DSM 17038]